MSYTEEDVREAYLDLAVLAHVGQRVADRQIAESGARRLAERHGLDEAALEGEVLDRVFAAMSTEELQRALGDPSRRRRARAELNRRGPA